MNSFYIYFLRRPDKPDPFSIWEPQPFYVGKGNNKRYLKHRAEARRGVNYNPIKISIIAKLWRQNTDFIEDVRFVNLTEKEAFVLEKQMIIKYGRINNGTGCLANLTDGGEGSAGCSPTYETRQKMKVAQLGEKHPMWGKHHTDEAKSKISVASKGRVVPAEVREKIRMNHVGFLGRSHTEETRYKMKIARKGRKPMLGKRHTDDAKQKMSKAHSGGNHHMWGRHHTQQTKDKISKTLTGRKTNMTETALKLRGQKISVSKKYYNKLRRWDHILNQYITIKVKAK